MHGYRYKQKTNPPIVIRISDTEMHGTVISLQETEKVKHTCIKIFQPVSSPVASPALAH